MSVHSPWLYPQHFLNPHTIAHHTTHHPAQGIAIRVYGVILAFLIVFNELGWTRFVRETPLLQNWVSRGSIYAL